MTRFGEQIIDFLEHLDVDRVVLGGTSLGANVTLEVAQANPERLRGMLLEMPALDNRVEAGILTFARCCSSDGSFRSRCKASA